MLFVQFALYLCVNMFTPIVFATPLGLHTIVYPTAYGGDTKTGASMAMISNVLSVITIPLIHLVFCMVIRKSLPKEAFSLATQRSL